MNTLIIALYDKKDLAKETIDELKDAGIKGSHIEHISSPGHAHTGRFKGLFSQQEKDQKDAKKSLQELTERGIGESDAHAYANGVRQGLDLLIVDLNDESLSHKARAIMDRRAHSARPAKEKLGSPHRGGIVESAASEGISTASTGDAEHPTRTYSSSASQEPLVGTSATSSPTTRSRGAIPRSDELRGGATNSTQKPLISDASTSSERTASRNDTSRFESAFREHYQRNFADSRYSYEDFALAYRYGVALAEEPRYESHSWDQVEPMAHQSWETRETGPWKLFRDAIHFGWNRIRGEHQSEPLPPRL